MYFTRFLAVETMSTTTMRCRDGGNSDMSAATASISFLKFDSFHLLLLSAEDEFKLSFFHNIPSKCSSSKLPAMMATAQAKVLRLRIFVHFPCLPAFMIVV
jgi:hypothetical protein